MDVRIDEVGQDAVIVVCSGRLNMVTAPELREAVKGVVAGGRKRIVVELGDVNFIDSSGLGAIVGSLKTARQAGGDLRVARPSEEVLMVLKMSNIDRVLRPYASAQEALQA